MQLAGEMTARFHGAAAAQSAREGFESRFSKGALPEDLEEVSVSGAPIGIGQLLREAGLVASGSEAMRNVEQGGVRIDGDKGSDKGLKLGAGIYVVQVGKRRAARVTVS